MPLAVTRTYDSRDKRLGDFGVGWTLGVSDVRIQKNGIVGGTDIMPLWDVSQEGTIIGRHWVVKPIKPRIVTVTLPDGTVYVVHAGESFDIESAL